MRVTPELAATAGDAVGFLEDAYRRRLRRPGRTADHPIGAAELLLADGQPSSVVVAGLLHDILEDTDVTSHELERFGPSVTRLVRAVTQDDTIQSYRERKAALRRQTVAAGPQAVAVALADKLAKLRTLTDPPRRRRLAHYRATLDEAEAAYGSSRLARQLRQELDRWTPR